MSDAIVVFPSSPPALRGERSWAVVVPKKNLSHDKSSPSHANEQCGGAQYSCMKNQVIQGMAQACPKKFPSWRSPTTIEKFICITIPKKGHKRIATQIKTCWNHLQGVAKFGGFRRTVHVLQLHKVDGFTQVRFQKHNSTNLGVGYFLTWCKASFVILKTLHPRATLNERIQRWLYSTPLQFKTCLKRTRKISTQLEVLKLCFLVFLVGGRRRTHTQWHLQICSFWWHFQPPSIHSSIHHPQNLWSAQQHGALPPHVRWSHPHGSDRPGRWVPVLSRLQV